MSTPNFQFGPPAGVHAGMPAQSSQPAPQQAVSNVQDPTRVTVGPVVISFPNVFVPRARPNAKPDDVPKYSAEFIIFPDNPNANAIMTSLMGAAEIACQAKFKRSITTMEKQPLRNYQIRDETKQGWFFGANSPRKPAVLAGNPPEPVVDPDAIYGGALVYVNVKAEGYDVEGGKGVKFYLNSVWKVADGTPLAPPRDGRSDFAEFLHLVPPTPAAVYAPPVAPVQQYAAPPAYQQVPPAYQVPPMQYGQPQMPGYPQQ
jgi:hypothetical protein